MITLIWILVLSWLALDLFIMVRGWKYREYTLLYYFLTTLSFPAMGVLGEHVDPNFFVLFIVWPVIWIVVSFRWDPDSMICDDIYCWRLWVKNEA